jgi:fructokinase
MISGAHEQARWMRPEPRGAFATETVERMIHTALPRSRVLKAQPLAGGLRNACFKVHLNRPPTSLVLRIYRHDASLCQKEVDLIRVVGDSVPVPQIIHAEPGARDGLPPFLLSRYVDGISFRELARSGDRDAIAQAACSAGEALARIGQVTFGKCGWISPGPAVTAPLLKGSDPMPRFVDLCLQSPNLQAHMPPDLRRRTSATIWSGAPQLAVLGREARLVHGDFNKRNLLVRPAATGWSVTAVLDWEFAVSGSPLGDIGNFLRYERASRPRAEPHFSAGYFRAGGRLPDDWRHLSRLVDLVALCELLTHDELPSKVVPEVLQLVRATIDRRNLESRNA